MHPQKTHIDTERHKLTQGHTIEIHTWHRDIHRYTYRHKRNC